MGGPWLPCVYLAPLWPYGTSNVSRTDVYMERKMEERKEEGGGEGKGKGKGKGKRRKGKGKRRKGKGIRKEEVEGEEDGKWEREGKVEGR